MFYGQRGDATIQIGSSGKEHTSVLVEVINGKSLIFDRLISYSNKRT
jgi:hypothetical protein